MYGEDVERLLTAVSKVWSSGLTIMNELSKVNDPIYTDYGFSNSSHRHSEAVRENTKISEIDSAAFNSELLNVKEIEKHMFVVSSKYNNSAGSPFTEIYALESIINMCSDLPTNCVNARISTMSKIYHLVLAATAAKFAIITYQEFVQQAYNKMNGIAPEE